MSAGHAELPKPPWLKVRLRQGANCARLRRIVRDGDLHTVCEEALCPNQGQCWEHGRATLMILGDRCTRNCRFCGVSSERPARCDSDEPRRVADAVKAMGLADVVVTSVTRDDLPDGGAGVWADTVRRIRAAAADICVEVLVPDFGGSETALDTVLAAGPDVWGHNLETVPGLYPSVRPQADYARSLDVLRRGHAAGRIVKTGIMLGLGETAADVAAPMRDAREAGADIFYAGQYLRPSREHLPVVRYVEPAEFDAYGEHGREIGFPVVVSGPLVRSSFHSDEQAAYVASAQG